MKTSKKIMIKKTLLKTLEKISGKTKTNEFKRMNFHITTLNNVNNIRIIIDMYSDNISNISNDFMCLDSCENFKDLTKKLKRIQKLFFNAMKEKENDKK